MRVPQHYPSTDHLRRAARRRLPRFAYDYVDGGTGPEVGLRRNREALDAVTLIPPYVTDWEPVDMSVDLFGRISESSRSIPQHYTVDVAADPETGKAMAVVW